MRNPPAAADHASNGLRRLIVAATVLALIGCAAAGYWLWVLRDHRLQFNDRQVRLQTAAVAEHLGVVFASADTSLRATVRDLREGLLDPNAASPALHRRVGANANLLALSLLDADGRVLGRSSAGAAEDASADPVTDPARALAARRPPVAADDAAPHVVAAVFAGRPAIELLRRAGTDAGAGWLVGVLDTHVVTDFFDRVAIAKDAHVGVFSADGQRLAGDLDLMERSDDRPAGKAADTLRALLRRPDAGVLGRYVVAAQPVGKLPMIVVSGRERAAALAPWVDNAISTLAATLVALAALAFVVLRLHRETQAHRQAQRELERTRERTRLAFDAAREGTWAWEAGAPTIEISPRMAALLEVRTTRLEASFLSDERVHRDDRAAIEHAVHAHLKGYSEQLVTQFRVTTADGGLRWIHARGGASRDALGRVLRVVGTASDETDARRRSDQLHALQTQLQRTRRLESLGRLSGGIAHDFNNILAVILGFGDLARRQAAHGSQQALHLEQLLRAGERGRHLVGRILAFSSGVPRAAVAVEVDALIAEVLALLPATAPPTLVVEPHLESSGAAVLGDPTLLFEAIGNLCSNAVLAMPRGGVLRLSSCRVETAEPLPTSHGTVAPGRHVRIDVCDDGDGMSADTIEHLFEPFFTTRRERGGTGLGLSTVHGAVKDMNGAIDVASTLGGGSRFSLILPEASPRALTLPDAAAGVPPRGHGEVVMVVDDEPALVALTEDVLAELGYEPAGFCDPVAALDAFSRTPGRFDAVLTDQLMPALSGIELARRVRALRPDIPVLLTSGYGGNDLARRACEAGVTQLARKPLRRDELAALLAGVLPGRAGSPPR